MPSQASTTVFWSTTGVAEGSGSWTGFGVGVTAASRSEASFSACSSRASRFALSFCALPVWLRTTSFRFRPCMAFIRSETSSIPSRPGKVSENHMPMLSKYSPLSRLPSVKVGNSRSLLFSRTEVSGRSGRIKEITASTVKTAINGPASSSSCRFWTLCGAASCCP